MQKHPFQRLMTTIVFGAAIALVHAAADARPTSTGTAFTYQGQLKQGGDLVNNTADMQFSLWDGTDGSATQIGTTLQVDALNIVDGALTVDLDFGAGAFGAEARWLQIAVRSPAGSGTFTTLTPRQRVRPAPVASHAMSVNGASVTNLSAGNIATGTIDNARTTGTHNPAANTLVLRDANGSFAGGFIVASSGLTVGANALINGIVQAGNGFIGSGGGLTELRASQIFQDQSGPIPGQALVGGAYGQLDLGNVHITDSFIDDSNFSGNGGGLYGVPAGFLTAAAGPLPNECISGNYAQQASFTHSNNLFVGRGQGLTLLNASNIASGNLNIARMPTGGTWALTSTQFVTGPAGFSTAFRVSSEDFNAIEGSTNEDVGVGAYGINTSAANGRGVVGQASGTGSFGIFAQGNSGASGTKSFQIDHPRDPENTYLLHYSAEGPEPYNLYRGNVILNGAGEAWVNLPDYFEDINRDFHYQLTSIGAPSPNLHVALEIVNNEFMIAGGKPGAKVSWTVTAVRNDEYARHNPTTDVREKPSALKGTYQHPEIFGQPMEKGEAYRREHLAELEN